MNYLRRLALRNNIIESGMTGCKTCYSNICNAEMRKMVLVALDMKSDAKSISFYASDTKMKTIRVGEEGKEYFIKTSEYNGIMSKVMYICFGCFMFANYAIVNKFTKE